MFFYGFKTMEISLKKYSYHDANKHNLITFDTYAYRRYIFCSCTFVDDVCGHKSYVLVTNEQCTNPRLFIYFLQHKERENNFNRRKTSVINSNKNATLREIFMVKDYSLEFKNKLFSD